MGEGGGERGFRRKSCALSNLIGFPIKSILKVVGKASGGEDSLSLSVTILCEYIYIYIYSYIWAPRLS